jgi:hypothetical protein
VVVVVVVVAVVVVVGVVIVILIVIVMIVVMLIEINSEPTMDLNAPLHHVVSADCAWKASAVTLASSLPPCWPHFTSPKSVTRAFHGWNPRVDSGMIYIYIHILI